MHRLHSIPAGVIWYPERTARFAAYHDPKRLSIELKPSAISEIIYRATPESEPQEFAHCWQIRGWKPEDEGKWTINRSYVCMANEWWPAEYKHNTLQDLLNHLEETFVEGVPANQPD